MKEVFHRSEMWVLWEEVIMLEVPRKSFGSAVFTKIKWNLFRFE